MRICILLISTQLSAIMPAVVGQVAAPIGAATDTLTSAPTVGYLFYRGQSWDHDSQAKAVEITSYQPFPTLTRVTTVKGNVVEVFPGQYPFFVPVAGASAMASTDAIRLIDIAIQRYPQREKLLNQVKEAELPPEN